MKQITWMFGLLTTLSCQAAVVECAGKIAGKTEFFRAQVDSQHRLVPWSKTALVSAKPDSAFAPLTDLEHFGVEGSSRFMGKNGYSLLSVTNAHETVTLGLSPQMNLGFYSSQIKVPMSCRTVQ